MTVKNASTRLASAGFPARLHTVASTVPFEELGVQPAPATAVMKPATHSVGPQKRSLILALRSCLLACVCTWMLVASARPIVSAADDESGQTHLNDLTLHYYEDRWRFSPDEATSIGVHTHDTEVGSYTPGDFAHETARLRSVLESLANMDEHTLSLNSGVDRLILENAVRRRLFELRDVPDWRREPGYYNDIASGSIYALMAWNFAPLQQRFSDVIAREQKIPGLLAQGKSNLDVPNVAPVVAKFAVQDVDGSIDFFSHGVPSAFASVKDARLQSQFRAANAGVVRALRGYNDFLRHTVVPKARGSYALGAKRFEYLADLENGAHVPIPRLLSAGEAAVASDRANFIAAARAIDPHRTPAQVYAELGKDHPSASRLLPEAQQQLAGLAKFIRDHHILDLPNAPVAKVVATPPFEASTTFAAFESPGPLERKVTQSYYYVTPVPHGLSHQQVDDYLSSYNRPELALVSAHEIYPGHYTDYLFNRQSNLSLIRRIQWNPAFGEGWAHYGEQMMVEEGLGSKDPRYRLAQSSEALLRDCRLIVGIKEHTQNMTVDEGTKMFVNRCFQPRGQAYSEAVRGTTDPLYGHYTWGKLMILKLRSDYHKLMGTRYTLAAFHDAILSHGDPPIALLRKLLLGSQDDGSLL